MNTPQHDRITRTLAREAEEFHRRGGSELEIGQVLARAGEIRRGRRMRATMLMAACVLAVAAPIGIVSLGGASDEPQPAPAPKVDRSPITLEGLKAGAAPKTGYATAGSLHLADGFEVAVTGAQGPPVSFAQFDGGVLLATRDEGGNLSAEFFRTDQEESTGKVWPMEGDFAVSPLGIYGAFVQPDGTPVAVSSSGVVEMPRIPSGTGFEVVGVSGDSCGTKDGCGVFVNSKGTKQAIWVSDSDGTVERETKSGFVLLSAMSSRGDVAGFTSITDDGSCSAVSDSELNPLWETCEHRLTAFSPDGDRLLASGPYASGMGDGELAILDSDDGRPVLDLRTSRDATITQMTWEDGGHVLATIFEKGRWAVVRIGLDGSREYALAPVPATDDVESPFVLPAG